MAKERTKWIHIRVTDEERSSWHSLAAAQQLTLADLIRQKMCESQPTGRQPKRRKRYCQQVDPALIQALARIGNNLNQIARWSNTYKSAADAVAVCTWLLTIHRQLTDLQSLPQHPTSPDAAEGDGHAD